MKRPTQPDIDQVLEYLEQPGRMVETVITCSDGDLGLFDLPSMDSVMEEIALRRNLPRPAVGKLDVGDQGHLGRPLPQAAQNRWTGHKPDRGEDPAPKARLFSPLSSYARVRPLSREKIKF